MVEQLLQKVLLFITLVFASHISVVLLDITNLALGNWMSVQHDGDPSITGNNQALYQVRPVFLLVFISEHGIVVPLLKTCIHIIHTVVIHF